MAQPQLIDVLPQATYIYQCALEHYNSDGDLQHAGFLCKELIKTLETPSNNISWTPSLKTILLQVRVLLMRLFAEDNFTEEAFTQAKLVFCEELNGGDHHHPFSSECCGIFDGFIMDRMMNRDLANNSTIQMIVRMQELLEFTFGPAHDLSLRNQVLRANCEGLLEHIGHIRSDSPDGGYESFEETEQELEDDE